MSVDSIPNIELFQTGDVLLFADHSWYPSRFIEFATHSKYSHVGIVLRDPCFGEESLKGLYILESTAFIDADDVETHTRVSGVQINRFDKVYDITEGEIYWRRLHIDRNNDFNDIMTDVHRLTFGKGYDYDPKDWIKAFFDIHNSNDERTDKFDCSALVAFIYDRLGLLIKPVDWTIIRPKDWGCEDEVEHRRVKIDNEQCTLDDPIQIKFCNNNKSYIGMMYDYVMSIFN